jgi:hypothetical protein
MPNRPNIPAPVQRAVRVEAGHRCAIPTCRQTHGLEIHHIKEWAKGGTHVFDNLILLCAICHSRVTSGEIDAPAVRMYKANLGLIRGRYGDLELRIIERFVEERDRTEVVIDASHRLLLQYLVDDGMLEFLGAAEGAFIIGTRAEPSDEDAHGPMRWGLTAEGRLLVERYRTAQEIV